MTEHLQTELSEREVEILRLVATGASNKEIAYKLSISANTVKVHLRNVFSKISATSRTEAAMYAVKMGLVPAGTTIANVNIDSTDADSIEIVQVINPPPTERVEKKENSSARIWILSGLAISILFLWMIGIIVWRARGSNQPIATGTPEAPQSVGNSLERWKAMADLPTARVGMAAVAYDGKIYAIAGETQNGPEGVVEVYDPASNTWKSGAAKPVPVTDVGAATIGGKIYVPGGRLDVAMVTSTVEIYDPIAEAWSLAPSLPVALSAYAITAYEGQLYVFGGWDGKAYAGSVYAYKPGDAFWSVKANMPAPCGYGALAVIKQKFHIVGCFGGQQVSSEHWVYNPVLDHDQSSPWQVAASLPAGEARYGLSAQSMADSLYVVGGSSDGSNALTFALTYDSQSDQWLPVISPTIESRKGMGSAIEGNYLYVFGGMIPSGPTNQHWSYQAIYTLSVPVFIGP